MFGRKKTRKQTESLAVQLRRYFLAGLLIVGPIGITLVVVWWFISLVDKWVKPLFDSWFKPFFETVISPAVNSLYVQFISPYLPDWLEALGGKIFPLPFELPGIGLLFAIFLLMFIGALATNLFGRSLVALGEAILHRTPVVRGVYRSLKQVFETVLSDGNASFQKVGVIEYPRQGLFAMVFVSKETTGEIPAKLSAHSDKGFVSVFLPTTPNPTSGFLLFVPAEEITILDMKVEDAAKMIISAGLVEPEHHGPYNPYTPPPTGYLSQRQEGEPKKNSASAGEHEDILEILTQIQDPKN